MPPRPRTAAPDELPPESNAGVAIPDFFVDPLVHVGHFNVEVEVFGRAWTVGYRPAVEWLKILWEDDLDLLSLFPGTAGSDDLEALVMDGLIEQTFDTEELFDICMEIIEEVCGFKWWFALQLIMFTKQGWARLGGLLVTRGVDPREMSIGSWLSAVLALCVEHMEPKAYVDLITQLNTPPEGMGPEPEELMEMEESAFLAAMNTPF
jgi:hypothetical protein